MKATWFTVGMIALAVAAIVLASILSIWYLFPAKSVTSTTRGFDITGVLPTSPVNSTNPSGCGVNKSVAVFSLRPGSRLVYNVSVDGTGDSLNFWVLGLENPPTETRVNSTVPAGGVVVLGPTPPSLEFVFQGCGSTLTVPYTLSGSYTYGSSS